MSKKVRVGVIGTSWYTDYMHYPAIQSHDQAELVAICGRNQQRAKEMAAKYGSPKIFGDYKKMIQDSDLDAILIATPNDLHYEMTMDALDAGLHVLCEKPLAMNARQAWEMYQKAEKTGVKHTIYFTFRWAPYYQYVRNLINRGFLGRFFLCEFRFPQGHGRQKKYRWEFDKNRSNGIVAELGTHMVDIARWLVGDITSITTQLGVFIDRPGADGGNINPANECATSLVKFANGAHGTFQVSGVAHIADRFFQQQIRLYGEDGSLEIEVIGSGSEAGTTIRAARSQDDQFQILEVPDFYWGDADPLDTMSIFTRNSVGTRQFIDAILEDHPVEPNFYDGFKAQQVVDAALESHEKGCAVNIDNSV